MFIVVGKRILENGKEIVSSKYASYPNVWVAKADMLENIEAVNFHIGGEITVSDMTAEIHKNGNLVVKVGVLEIGA